MRSYMIIIAMMWIGWGCSDNNGEPVGGEEFALQFTGNLDWENEEAKAAHATRTASKTGFLIGDKTGLLGYNTVGLWSVSNASAQPTQAYNTGLTYKEGASFDAFPVVYYPNAGYLTLFAYYPYALHPGDSGITLSSATEWWGPPYMEFEIHPDPDKQVDLLYASVKDLVKPVNGINPPPVPLNFKHVLTQVKFTAKLSSELAVDLGYTAEIDSITLIANPYSPYLTGKFLFDSGGWYMGNRIGNITALKTMKRLTSTTETLLSTLMMIPQEVNGVKFKINYRIIRDGKVKSTGEKSITRYEWWYINQIVNYTLTIIPEDDEIVISSSIAPWINGGNIEGVA